MPVCDGKIQQAPRLDVGDIVFLGDLAHELIDLGDGLDHDPAQELLPKPFWPRIRARIGALLLHQVEEQRKRPLAVRAALDAQVPAVRERGGQRSLDVLPATDVAVVHPHQGVVLERVAVVLCQGALCGGSHMGEDEVRAGFARQTLQVLTVPGRERRREDAWLRPQLGVWIEPNAKAIPIDGTTGILRV